MRCTWNGTAAVLDFVGALSSLYLGDYWSALLCLAGGAIAMAEIEDESSSQRFGS